ncbi:MAG: hypothetical protein PHF86_01075 [Candidatus Nanoarchaeia archaeon]|nr:hypothetical protein [Candidatus Nanoarchaeia archaeon]
MKVYKIKHKPTGLFFVPSRGGNGNLSTGGKIYSKFPSLNWIGDSIRIVIRKWEGEKLSKKEKLIVEHFKIDQSDKKDPYWIDRHFGVPIEDWEIIEL